VILLKRKKEQLESFDRRIVQQQRVVQDLSSGLDDSNEAVLALERRTAEITNQLAELRNSERIAQGSNFALEEIVHNKEVAIKATTREIRDLTQRIDGIELIRSEIETEIDTLALNEESRRVFESFEDICRNPNCGLFIGSSESYAKNLLYLRDQIKDLERNALRASARLDELRAQLKLQESELSALLASVKTSSSNNGIDRLISAIQQLTQDLFATEQKRSAISIFKQEKQKYIKLDNEREKLLDRIANLSTTGQADFEFNKLRASLKLLIVKWLDIIETKNVSRNVEIDLDFKVKFDGEGLDAIKGSTKIRVVLAVHAALFEHYLADKSRPFRFFILDTPKQQEMQTEDLGHYLTQLGAMCEQSDAQLIFSSTEYRHQIGAIDSEWLPTFDGPKQSMYLGTISDLI